MAATAVSVSIWRLAGASLLRTGRRAHGISRLGRRYLASSGNPPATVVDDVQAAAVTLTDEDYYRAVVGDHGVEVRLCQDEGRGRGLFATRDFAEGEVVFVDTALLISSNHDLLAATHFRMGLEPGEDLPRAGDPVASSEVDGPAEIDYEEVALKKLQGLLPFRQDAPEGQAEAPQAVEAAEAHPVAEEAAEADLPTGKFVEVDADDAERYSNHCHVCFESVTPVVEAGEEVLQRPLTDQDVAKILAAIPVEQYPLQRKQAMRCECPACQPFPEHAAIFCSPECADQLHHSGRHVVEALIGGPPGRVRAAMGSMDEFSYRYDGHWYMVFQTLCQLAAGGEPAAAFLNSFARLCWHQEPERSQLEDEQFQYILKLFRHWFQGCLSPEDRLSLLGSPEERALAEAADPQLMSEDRNPFALTEAYRSLQGGLPGYWLTPAGFWRISSVVSTNAFRIPVQSPRIVLRVNKAPADKPRGGRGKARQYHDIYIRWHENPVEDPAALDCASVFPLASYMNHACMGVHNIVATAPVFSSSVAFAALRPIKRGEELLWCYNTDVEAMEAHYRFKCGCRICVERQRGVEVASQA